MVSRPFLSRPLHSSLVAVAISLPAPLPVSSQEAGPIEAALRAADTLLPISEAALDIEQGLAPGAWPGALKDSSFFEISVADNGPPPVRTNAFLIRTKSDLFVAFQSEDPSPAEIRSYLAPRDQVFYTQDFVQVEIDPTGDGQASQFFRVNPLGVQGDGIFTESTAVDDFGPDFLFSAVTARGPRGWSAAFRIPLQTLASHRGEPRWRVVLLRNHPRGDRYLMVSSRIPRQSTCWLCHGTPIAPGSEIERGSRVTALPFVSEAAAEPRTDDIGADMGMDVQWDLPSATRMYVTLNPDFSHVEADVPQLEANRRFALEYPEKRPFFLESADLLATIVPIFRTRSIADPRAGVRVTDRSSEMDVTLLTALDGGGGSRTVPGVETSSAVPADAEALVALGRVRWRGSRTIMPGLGVSLREEHSTRAYNRLVSPDVRWQPGPADVIQAQLVASDSQEPNSPDVESSLDGQRLQGVGWLASWRHASQRLSWSAEHGSMAGELRAENGYLPQIGVRHWQGSGALVFEPSALFHRVEPTASLEQVVDTEGRLVERVPSAGVTLQGSRGLILSILVHPRDELRFEDRLFSIRHVDVDATAQPGRRVSRLSVSARVGEDVDFDDARLVTGREISLQALSHPTAGSEVLVEGGVQALTVTDEEGERGTLLEARTVTAQLTHALNPASHLRLRWTHTDSRREAALDREGEGYSEASHLVSALLSFRVRTFTTLFIGGDTSLDDDRVANIRSRSKRLFAKFSYYLDLGF